LAAIVEFIFPAFDRNGKRTPVDDEAYWGVAMLFGDPSRTIQQDVYIGQRKRVFRRSEPLDSLRFVGHPPN
jgi:hypothetical protein